MAPLALTKSKRTVSLFTRSLRDFAPVQAGQSCALSVNRLHPYGCFVDVSASRGFFFTRLRARDLEDLVF